MSGACTGEEVSLSIGVDGVPTLEPGNDFGEQFMDNVGTCFYSEITVNSFLLEQSWLMGDGIGICEHGHLFW